jgi:nitrate reductase gamma subunit
MRVVSSFLLVGALSLVAFVGARAGGEAFLAIGLPYLAVAIFFVGIAARVIGWARSAVPFRIPTTCGQQRSLPWIKSAPLENPSTGLGATARVLLEVLTFRSLFRNTRAELKEGGRLVYSSDKWLWAAALAFHYSFLVVLLRHFRFFSSPVPVFVTWLQGLDGFFQIGVPELYVTDVLLVAAVGFLLLRRLADAGLRYISLAADYFPLALILGIGISGIWIRYFGKVDVEAVKNVAIGLVTFHPAVPRGIGSLVYVHLFLVSVLFAYFPFSKLVHMAGVFLSPTRNLANNNRMRRHVNPWNPPIIGHTYAEWEHDYHDKLVTAGIPLDGK